MSSNCGHFSRAATPFSKKRYRFQRNYSFNAAEPIMMNPKIVTALFKSSAIESFGAGFEISPEKEATTTATGKP
jgi:hypothetical protein